MDCDPRATREQGQAPPSRSCPGRGDPRSPVWPFFLARRVGVEPTATAWWSADGTHRRPSRQAVVPDRLPVHLVVRPLRRSLKLDGSEG